MAEKLTIPFRWLGSKVRMRKNILPILKEIPRNLYVEPFGGSGAILFAKEPELSVYNDKNLSLVNFFKILKDDCQRAYLKKLANITPINARTFYFLREILRDFLKDERTLEPTMTAFAFFYVHNFTFGAVPNGPWGGEALEKTCRRNVANLDAFAKKLKGTDVRCFDFRNCFRAYDNEKTLFYCDPPYVGTSSKNYGRGGGPTWNDDDTKALIERLATLNGSAVLSCYDDELYVPLLSAGYERRTFNARTTCARKKEGRAPRVETVYLRIRG